MKLNFFLSFIIFCTVICAAAGNTKQKVFIFGDSLSDSGYANNFHNIDESWPLLSKHPLVIKQATYTSPDKHATVWPQFLASMNIGEYISVANNISTPPQNINKSVTPILNGDNYAAGGATTICEGLGKHGEYIPPPIGPLRKHEKCPKNQVGIQKYNQIDSYLKQYSNKADPDAIYIIWGGANNAFLELNYLLKNESILNKITLLIKYLITDDIEPVRAIQKMKNAARDIAYDSEYLIMHGAKASNIYIINLPNLRIIPEATNNGKEFNSLKTKLFGSLSVAFNNELENNILPSKVNIVDAEKFFSKIVENKCIKVQNKQYFFSNVTQSACNSDGPNALTCIPLSHKNSGKYLFEDLVHPTSYAHRALAIYIESIIENNSQKVNLSCG